MKTFYIGIDVSKGYADIAIMEESGGLVSGGGRYDDTPQGHEGVKGVVQGFARREEEFAIKAGLESSGGLERNWLKLFKKLSTAYQGKVYLLNPLAVKKFLERDLHRNVTDAISAKGIAKYLRQGMRSQDIPYEDPEIEGSVSLYRCLRTAIGRASQMKNELQSLLPRTQPYLVQYCRQGIPTWVLTLLRDYPTAPKLARAKPEKLAKIPFITLEKAKTVIEDAKESIAAQNDRHTGIAVSFLSSELLDAEERLGEIKQALCDELSEDDGVKVMQSIPGIGLWSAVCLRLEIGAIERFPSPECLVAYAGLDPRIRQSGDSERHIGISRRGRRQIRAIIYLVALTAIRHNPVLKHFYGRLKETGKKPMVAVVACMRKMLHIIYGCWISGKLFDPCRHMRLKENTPPADKASLRTIPDHQSLSLKAPISRREAMKRKAKALPQTRNTRDMRGLGSAFQGHFTTLILKGAK